MTAELKPCPFCGRSDITIGFENTRDAVYIYCCKCRIQGPWTNDITEAGTAWNQRAPAPPPVIRDIEPIQFRDISTAPKDGSTIILRCSKGILEGAWEQVDGGGHPENGPPVYWWTSPFTEFIDGPYDAPTHWSLVPRDADLAAAPQAQATPKKYVYPDRCPYCSFDPTSLSDYCDEHRPTLTKESGL